MEVTFYLDPDTDEPHCLWHNVSPREVIEILSRPGDRARSKEDLIVVAGQTQAGRYLRVVYRERGDGSVLVITAYDLTGNAKRAFRRRRKR